MEKRPISVRSESSRKVETDGKVGLEVMDQPRRALLEAAILGPPHLGYSDRLCVPQI